jgi:hypothetical protein
VTRAEKSKVFPAESITRRKMRSYKSLFICALCLAWSLGFGKNCLAEETFSGDTDGIKATPQETLTEIVRILRNNACEGDETELSWNTNTHI